MTKQEKAFVYHLACEFEDLVFAFYRAAGCEGDESLQKLYRKDFRKWDKLVKQAKEISK